MTYTINTKRNADYLIINIPVKLLINVIEFKIVSRKR